MLELSNFQIFFMVLHAGILLFLVAFLTRGATNKTENVIPSGEMRRRRRNRKKKRKSTSQATVQPADYPYDRAVRDVREIRNVRDLLQPPMEDITLSNYQLAAPKRKSS